MKRLTVAAAAFAAGMLTIVAQSQAEADRDSFRRVSIGTRNVAKTAKASDADSPEANAKAKDRQQQASAKGKDGKNEARLKDAKDKKVGDTKLASARSEGRKKKGRTKIDLDRPDLDKQVTASVTRVRPELKAVARKAIKGLDQVASVGKVAEGASYTTIVSHYAASYGVPESLAHAVISVESNYRPDLRGSAGEIGLMQIKPATARAMGYSGSASGLFNPETNIKYGMKYLGMAHQLSGGSTCGTILRYNAGHGAKRMNPVSAAYCVKVKARLAS
jgi:soluble lytic murein transglycosylase-like protein